MSATPSIICSRCGSRLERRSDAPANDDVICVRCRARFTRDDLEAVADAQFTKDVDDALSRVREMNRRYPHR